MPRSSVRRLSRRTFQQQVIGAAAAVAAGGFPQRAPAQVTADSLRPSIEWGVASGDVSLANAVLWSRTDRPARMIVELAGDDTFRGLVKTLVAADSLEPDDFTAKIGIGALPAGAEIHYRVRFESLEHRGAFSESVTGRFKIPPRERRPVRFLWSGDVCGQGWGIDPARGGLKMFETMRQRRPDFFIHSGDTIYADGPFSETVTLPNGGGEWKNIVTPETAKVAETLDEYRARFRYNHLDENYRKFHAEVPVFVQWDDHEVLNNWYPDEILNDSRYTTKSVALLAARSKRAFFEYHPIRAQQVNQVYRSFMYGPDLELFIIDMRTHRGANSPNRQLELSAASSILGAEQLEWLKAALAASTATWKVICSDMPIGLIVGDGNRDFEAVANGSGRAMGRELEIANLLSFLKTRKVKNVIWLTADVHYAASHYYDPNVARFPDFDPFWEFVSGPAHAGTGGPGRLDDTFGPRVEFNAPLPRAGGDKSPAAGFQFFGQIDLDSQSRELTVGHYNVAGEKLWEKKLSPAT